MDLYSLHTSIESVLDYLERVDPAAARGARHRYACFEHFSHEPQAYGAATTYHGKEPCEDEVVSQLLELQTNRENSCSATVTSLPRNSSPLRKMRASS